MAGAEAAGPAQTGALQRLAVPREKTWAGAGGVFDRMYRHGGSRLFTRPALAAIAVLAIAGLAVFPYLVVGRYGTPFVVAQKVGVGALIFLVGRLAVVAVHETAHGLTMASYGRRVRRAGLKVLLVFPYAFVDTSEAWFEPRRRRIAISAAGPIVRPDAGRAVRARCLALPAGAIRDILFQLAFAAYVGAFFNLNPFVERDGYQILVDVLREPGLRRRAREQLFRRLSGQGERGRLAGCSAATPRRASRGRWSRPASRRGSRCDTSHGWPTSRPAPVVWAVLAASGWASSCR